MGDFAQQQVRPLSAYNMELSDQILICLRHPAIANLVYAVLQHPFCTLLRSGMYELFMIHSS